MKPALTANLDLPTPAAAARQRSQPLTVLFVHQSSDLYGSDRMLLACATALQQANGRAIVVLPGRGPLHQALRQRGIEVHALTDESVLKLSRAVLSIRGIFRLLASTSASQQQLDRCVFGRRVDLVVTSTLAVLAGVPWARRHGVPHLWHVHEIVERPRWAAKTFPWLLRLFADRVVCNSGATQRWLLDAQPPLAARTGVVINGVDDPQSVSSGPAALAPEAQQALHRRFRPAGVSLAIGLVGRINRLKGHGVLLQAAQWLHEQGLTDFSLVFIGDAPAGQLQHQQLLQAKVEASGLAARVVFTGFLADTTAAYRALDIVCVPSVEAESFGLVAIEAMALGLPVVASDIGGLPEVVLHQNTGMLHKAGDARGLADALALLLQDAALRQALGQAGRQRYEHTFAADLMGPRIVSEFRLAARGAAP